MTIDEFILESINSLNQSINNLFLRTFLSIQALLIRVKIYEQVDEATMDVIV